MKNVNDQIDAISQLIGALELLIAQTMKKEADLKRDAEHWRVRYADDPPMLKRIDDALAGASRDFDILVGQKEKLADLQKIYATLQAQSSNPKA